MQFCYYRDAGSHESQENISKTGTDASEATEGSEDVSVPVLAVSEEQAVAFRKNRNKRDSPCSQAHEGSPFFAQPPLDTAVIADVLAEVWIGSGRNEWPAALRNEDDVGCAVLYKEPRHRVGEHVDRPTLLPCAVAPSGLLAGCRFPWARFAHPRLHAPAPSGLGNTPENPTHSIPWEKATRLS